jgi:ankyrin repeat protein
MTSHLIETIRSAVCELGAYPFNASNEHKASLVEKWFKEVRSSIEGGADVNSADNNGCTALMHACELNDVQVVKCLVEQKADPNKTNSTGDTALSYAYKLGHFETIKYLVEEAKAEMFDFEKVQTSAFPQYSNIDEYIRILVYLEEKGLKINPNIADQSNGRTLFMIVAQFGDRAFLQSLKEKHNAKIHTEDNSKRTALNHAINGGRLENVQYLTEETARTLDTFRIHNALLHASNGQDGSEMVECLIRNHADPNFINRQGDTPLMLAAANGSFEKVKFLVEKMGASIHTVNKVGETALTKAVRGMHNAFRFCGSADTFMETVGYLLRSGALFDKDFFLKQNIFGDKDDEEGNFGKYIIRSYGKTLEKRISEILFTYSLSPFYGLANSKDTFGHYVAQTITDYLMPDTNQLFDISDKDWNELLDQLNSPQNRKNIDVYGYFLSS